MSDRNVLVINAGSSSLKYQLVEPATGTAVFKGLVERIGDTGSAITHHMGDKEIRHEVDVPDHTVAVKLMQQCAREGGVDLDHSDLAAVGHRVVHGGRNLVQPTIVDDYVLEEIDRVSVLAPLHNPGALQGLKAAIAEFPNTTHVTVFDTAFFSTMPRESRYYAIDWELAQKFAIRRYGFHGTSHQFVAHAAAAYLRKPLSDLKMIVLHLGNGASASAIDGGRPLDTSMGMTPLEGLVMGTRSGDIDPGVVSYLHRVDGMGVEEVDDLLNAHSGLLGMAGVADMRDLIGKVIAGDERASLCLNVYERRLQRYVGAYAAVLGRVDAIVFTAGVGENSPVIREGLAKRLEGLLGTRIDEQANAVRSKEPRTISRPESRTKLLVIPTNEEWAIAQQSLQVVQRAEKEAAEQAKREAMARR